MCRFNRAVYKLITRLTIAASVLSIQVPALAGVQAPFLNLPSWLGGKAEVPRNTTAPQVTPKELQTAISAGITKVTEFVYLRELAHKYNVKVYLFGGTAAAFAHYVKWDFLRRERNDQSYFPDRFDFRYINIYRANQDLDIVVDGPQSAIDEIAKLLATHFPYLQGNKGAKSSWEVRSLRESTKEKIALLNNQDFLDQHTDSNSVGMIEVSEVAAGEPIVRDLHDWENTQNPKFLQDVVEGKIRFYFSTKHETTSYFKQGRNPPILAVLRYFIKRFQFSLEPRSKDLDAIKKIIEDFDPRILASSPYLQKWFENNVPKLILNSIDLEKGIKNLTDVGLLEKLRAIGNPSEVNSVSWWMHRKPLESFPLGQRAGVSPGKTASELGLEIVAHETRSYEVYEALTRSHQGIPNVLISRKNTAGETAAFGDGFYTMRGHDSGFVGSGLTIRFKVNPEARENVDFTIAKNSNYIIFHNRNALTVIPENLRLNLIGYYNLMIDSEQISSHDQGLFHRLRLALRFNFAEPSNEEIEFVRNLPASRYLYLLEHDQFADSLSFLIRFFSEKEIPISQLTVFALWWTEMNKSGLGTPALTGIFRKPLVDKFLDTSTDLSTLLQLFERRLFEASRLFVASEDRFMATAIQRVKTPQQAVQLLTVYSTNNTYNRSGYFDLGSAPSLRKSLNKLYRLFFSLHPNEADVLSFLTAGSQLRIEIRPSDRVQIGLGSLHFDDPLVLATIFEAVSRDESSDLAKIKVWRKLKTTFFASEPTGAELTKFSQTAPIPEIQLDLLEHGLNRSVFKRRRDLLGFVESLVAFSEKSPSFLVERHDLLMKRTVDFFKTLNPTLNEVLQFFTSKGMGNLDQHLQNLFDSAVNLSSETDLLALIETFRSIDQRNKFVVDHLPLIGGLHLTYPILHKFLELLDYKIGSHYLIDAYFKQHPDFGIQVLNLFSATLKANPFGPAANQSPVLVDLWKRAYLSIPVHKRLEMQKTHVLTHATFSLDTYKFHLENAIQSSESLYDVSQIFFEDFKPRGDSSSEESSFPLNEEAAIKKLHRKLLTELLPRQIPRLLNLQPRHRKVDATNLKQLLKMVSSVNDQYLLLDLAYTLGIKNSTQGMNSLIPAYYGTEKSQVWLEPQIATYYIVNLDKVLETQNDLGPSVLLGIRKRLLYEQALRGFESPQNLEVVAEAANLLALASLRSIKTSYAGLPQLSHLNAVFDPLFSDWSPNLNIPELRQLISLQNTSLAKKYSDFIRSTYRFSGSYAGLSLADSRAIMSQGEPRSLELLEKNLELDHSESLLRWRTLLNASPLKAQYNALYSIKPLSCSATLAK
jgi:hypothetical protein